MAEYIERDALIQKYRSEIEKMREYAINTPNGDGGNVLECRGELTGMRMALEFIQRYPAADVVEVRHGRWDEVYGSDTIRCSCCRKRLDAYYADGVPFFEPDYCPNCGTRMDGGNRNGTD